MPYWNQRSLGLGAVIPVSIASGLRVPKARWPFWQAIHAKAQSRKEELRKGKWGKER